MTKDGEIHVWYDKEGDFLEVWLGDKKSALAQPTEKDDVNVTVDEQGNVAGFMVFNLTKTEGDFLDLTLRAPRPDDEKLITSEPAAKELGMSVRRLQALLQQGRVEGARKVGRDWVIPSPVRVSPGTRGPARVGAER